MAKKSSKSSTASAENPTTNFRIQHRINGEAPNARDTGADDKVTTPQKYKKGGKVKASTPYTY